MNENFLTNDISFQNDIRQQLEQTPKRAAFYLAATWCQRAVDEFNLGDYGRLSEHKDEIKSCIDFIKEYASGSRTEVLGETVASTLTMAKIKDLEGAIVESWTFDRSILDTDDGMMKKFKELKKTPGLEKNYAYHETIHKNIWAYVAFRSIVWMYYSYCDDGSKWKDHLSFSLLASAAALGNGKIKPHIEEPRTPGFVQWVLKDLALINKAAKKNKMTDETSFGKTQFSEAEKASNSGCASMLLFASLSIGAAYLLLLTMSLILLG